MTIITTCTDTRSGQPCGADIIGASYRGSFLRNGTKHRKYTCTAGHKRVLWLSPEGVQKQAHLGRGFGAHNKADNISIRPSVEMSERLKAAGITAQKWWDTCESLDILAVVR
jgi:hypothetical protein